MYFVILLPLLAAAAEPAGEWKFYRGLNLNGPAVVIDGQPWEGKDSPHYRCDEKSFEDKSVALKPATDDARTLMIRSSRWDNAFELRLLDLPDGIYRFWVYAWEDNNSERFTIGLDGREVLRDFESGKAGTWAKLGPWEHEVASEQVLLTARGGAANISGIEIWRLEPMPRDPVAAAHFDKHVAPILAKHCLECHGGSEHAGGLKLDTWRAAFQGGDSGPSLTAGAPDDSLLWHYISTDEMPKDRPALSNNEKSIVRAWIEAGAVWGKEPIDPVSLTTDRRAGTDWWSLQPIRNPRVPTINENAGWVRNDIDRFVLAQLGQRSLRPAAEADRRTLIRRLYFDLFGLPPKPEEVARFVADKDPKAYEKLVDSLLDSPHYGERWARHWLDVIRFGESQGYERNRIRENAWRYRDWVIDAFNRDLPYDQFVRLQIAGDVLAPNDLDAVLATGYHVCGTWDQVGHNEGSQNMRKTAREEHLEDLVATLGQAYMGLTINCARCHDHKFDPIRHADYYRMASLLGGIHQQEKEREGIKLTAGSSLASRDFKGTAHVPYSRSPGVFQVLQRGDWQKPGPAVTPSGLSAIMAGAADFALPADASDADRRLALANWLTHPDHPLVARVFVNRIWHYHFGQGLVDTPSDFGFNGGKPSHPELLDALAFQFRALGWKIKDLHRLMVTSATYRQASQVPNDAAASVDSDNRLLWRANRQRLDGEAYRDTVLAVAGALNTKLGGPSFRDVAVALEQNHKFTTPTNSFDEDHCRRSIYRLWARSGNHPLLESLDCPDPSVMAPQRTRTITPVQALSMLNSPLIEFCSKRFAERLEREASGRDKQIDRGFQLVYQRTPTASEAALAATFVEQFGLAQWATVLFNTNEFVYVD